MRILDHVMCKLPPEGRYEKALNYSSDAMLGVNNAPYPHERECCGSVMRSLDKVMRRLSSDGR